MTDPVNTYWPLPSPDSLGNMVGADDVRRAVKRTILTWAPFYLGMVSQREALAGNIGNSSQPPNPLPNFGKWVNRMQNRSLGTGMPAAFIVTVPATVGKPEIQGNRSVKAVFRAQVIVQVFGSDWETTADLASWYEKAVRWSIVQHGALADNDGNPFATRTNWVGNQYSGEMIHEGTRTYGECVTAFDVLLPDVIDIIGPDTVPTPPVVPDDDPTVDDVIVTLKNARPNEPLEDAT